MPHSLNYLFQGLNEFPFIKIVPFVFVWVMNCLGLLNAPCLHETQQFIGEEQLFPLTQTIQWQSSPILLEFSRASFVGPNPRSTRLVHMVRGQ